MLYVLSSVFSVAVGVVLTAYRLKGDRTIIETLRAAAGGPGPRDR